MQGLAQTSYGYVRHVKSYIFESQFGLLKM